MNIWTCKQKLAALLILTTLSACAAGGEGGLFGSAPDDAAAKAETRPNVALLSAEMARGAIKLTPPDGFCIDKTALQQSFALLARCDSLGGRGGAQDAPLGLITVSVAQALEGVDTAVAASRLAPEGSAVLATQGEDGLTVLHLSGDTPQGSDPQHWRGLIQIGTHVMALGAYGPAEGRMARSDGGALLASLAQRTHDASIGVDVARNAADSATARNTGTPISGLFD
ncbi:MAG: hypothetical protein ABJL99_05615 [Aliishimia sp.]